MNSALHAAGLRVLGGLYEGADTLYLIGPNGARFWEFFQQSAEYRSGEADPVDRYSTRVLTHIAAVTGSAALFPFGGPPFQPFVKWALASGRCFQSPLPFLVHAELGLFTSYRGALRFNGHNQLPKPLPNPCESCAGKPCLSACPAAAVTEKNYNVAACHKYLDSEAGEDCMAQGCAVRRACPIGQAERPEAQSAFHMSYFHKKAAQ